MATERGQRTRIIFGGVTAEVQLLKTSGKPAEAKHDTKRIIQRSSRVLARPLDPREGNDWQDIGSGTVTLEYDDPLGGGEVPPASPSPPPPDSTTGEVRQGVYLEGGEFVDLTDRLAEIDERTRIDGMEVVACIPADGVPSGRIRDTHYVGSGGVGAPKVLALLWNALWTTKQAAVVCRTVKTRQALGVLVARYMAGDTVLLLLEMEWSEQMRDVPTSAVLSAEMTYDEMDAARALVEAYSSSPFVLHELRDERTAKRIELLTAAREGRLGDYRPPPERGEAEPDDLAAAFASAAKA